MHINTNINFKQLDVRIIVGLYRLQVVVIFIILHNILYNIYNLLFIRFAFITHN